MAHDSGIMTYRGTSSHSQSSAMGFREYKPSGDSRQLTPPDSPSPSSHTALGISSQDSTFRKMSLDFIAPGSRASQSPTSSSATYSSSTRSYFPDTNGLTSLSLCLDEMVKHNREHLCPNTPISIERSGGGYRPQSPVSGLPSPGWSPCSESRLTIQTSSLYTHQQTRHSHHHHDHDHQSDYTYSPHTNIQPSQLHGRNPHPKRRLTTPTATRPDRHPYDAEERYAIIHLRAVLGLKWGDVLKEFSRLFPPGEQRRCKVNLAPGMPQTYQVRNVQGLQCRWYRIREEEGLGPLRGEICKGGLGSEAAKVLKGMVEEDICGAAFLSEFR